MKKFPMALLVATLVAVFLVEPPNAYSGTLIPDRLALDGLLGLAGTTENFETFNLGGGPSLDVGTVLDSSTGPVVDGVAFSAFGNVLRILDQSFLGRTQVLDVAGSGPRTLLIDFSVPVNAFGLDFFPFVTIGTDVNVTVFAPDDSFVLENDAFTFFFPGFIGISDPAGIGSVAISATARPSLDFIKDVTVDNLTFGVAPTAIPEPATLLLVTVGLVGLRRPSPGFLNRRTKPPSVPKHA